MNKKEYIQEFGYEIEEISYLFMIALIYYPYEIKTIHHVDEIWPDYILN